MAYEDTQSTSGIERGQPEPDESRKAMVTALLADVRADKKKWEPAFKRMRADMKFVRVQLPEEADDDDRIKVNIVQRHIKQRVAALYAKNPTFIAQRRRRLDFKIWDEKRSSLQAAAEEVAMAQQAAAAGQMLQPSPETMALIQDIREGLTRRRQLDSVGRTLEVLFGHILDEMEHFATGLNKGWDVRSECMGVKAFKGGNHFSEGHLGETEVGRESVVSG